MGDDDGIINAAIISNSVNLLRNKIEELDKNNSKLQSRLYWLTIVTAILVGVQTIAIVVQILLQIYGNQNLKNSKNMSNQTINCPKYQTEISIDDVLTHQVEDKIKKENWGGMGD